MSCCWGRWPVARKRTVNSCVRALIWTKSLAPYDCVFFFWVDLWDKCQKNKWEPESKLNIALSYVRDKSMKIKISTPTRARTKEKSGSWNHSLELRSGTNEADHLLERSGSLRKPLGWDLVGASTTSAQSGKTGRSSSLLRWMGNVTQDQCKLVL